MKPFYTIFFVILFTAMIGMPILAMFEILTYKVALYPAFIFFIILLGLLIYGIYLKLTGKLKCTIDYRNNI